MSPLKELEYFDSPFAPISKDPIDLMTRCRLQDIR